MEIVDVVDESGKVLSHVQKDEAHEKGLLHPCVIGLLLNSKGEIMLIKPPTHKQDSGQYVAPVGGHISSGESEVEALKREVEEEIGIIEFTYKRIGQGRFERHVLGRHENHLFTMYEIYSDSKPIGGDELETMHWFTKDELKKEIKRSPKDFGDAFYFVFKTYYPELL